jgi:hypothetical protein
VNIIVFGHHSNPVYSISHCRQSVLPVLDHSLSVRIRSVIEQVRKERRNHMKVLCNQVNVLRNSCVLPEVVLFSAEVVQATRQE